MDSSHFEELGQNLLDSVQNQSQSYHSSTNSSSQESLLFVHLEEFSNFFKSLKISTKKDKISIEDADKIKNYVSLLFSDLSRIESLPNSLVGKGTNAFEAYKMISYAYYILNLNISQDEISFTDKSSVKTEENYEPENNNDEKINESSSNENATPQNENDLRLENNRLKAKLNKYAEIDREVNSLLIYLRHHFNLADTTNIHNILDAISIQNTCGLSEEDRIEHLNYKYQDLENRLILIQQEKDELEEILKDKHKQVHDELTKEAYGSNAKIFVLENDLSASQAKIKDLLQKMEDKKTKINTLQKQLAEKDTTLKQVERSYEDLIIKYDTLLIDEDDKNHKSSTENNELNLKTQLKIKDDTIFNLQNALNDLSDQLEKMNDDIQKESSIKNGLLTLLQKQNDGLRFAESAIQELEMHNNQLASAMEVQNQISNKKDNQKELFQTKVKEDLIKSYIEDFIKPEECDRERLQDIICNEDTDFNSRIINIIKFFINEIENSKNNATFNNKKFDVGEKERIGLQEENKRLFGYLQNMLNFMEQVSNSGDVQQFFIDGEVEDNFRDRLITQCKRVEAFLKENGLDDEENIINENFLGISNYALKISQQLKNPDVQELIMLIQQSAFANDILRKYSEDTKHQAEGILSELKAMRYQLNEQHDIYEEKLNNEANKLEIQLEKDQKRNEAIDSLQRFLRDATVSESKGVNLNDFALKCLQMLQQEVIDYSNIENENYDENNYYCSEKYVRKVENRLNKEIKSHENTKMIINKLKSKIISLRKQHENERKQYIEELEMTKHQVDELSDSISENEGKFNQTKNDLNEKNAIIESLQNEIRIKNEQIQKYINLQHEEKEAIKAEMKNESESFFREKDTTIKSLTESLESTQYKHQEKIKEMKSQMKATIKKLQDEIDCEVQRANEIRINYEKLLTDLKNKLSQSRISENKAKERNAFLENELKESKSALTKIRIDYKMLNIKVLNAEDKLKREKTLFDTQLKMKILGLQTDNQTQIEELKNKYDNDIHNLLLKICEIFRNYIDFNITITEEAVLDVLQNVANILKETNIKLINSQGQFSILSDIKGLLNITNDYDIVSSLKLIMKELNGFRENQEKLDQERTKVEKLIKKANIIGSKEKINREWETWAKRLHSLITDSFSTAKTNKQLQYAIEEALMGAIGQRQIWRKLEILRTEKNFLLSGVKVYPSNRKKKIIITFFHLVCIYTSIYRMQKLSGHVKYNISLSTTKRDELLIANNNSNIQSIDDILSPKKHFPIINYASES